MVLGWAAGYALVALAAGATGMAGIARGAGGFGLYPFLHLLAFSALTLAAALLCCVVSLLGHVSAPPRPGNRAR